jgi:hypothetical protein
VLRDRPIRDVLQRLDPSRPGTSVSTWDVFDDHYPTQLHGEGTAASTLYSRHNR